ncbi:MAG TPA: ABC transporter permease [Gammaproteobacteria bacterium]|jgi:putative ABC transport system permease protein|nr:ABC transporter permease [Gammaproteobacteria bacterium]
MTLALIARMAWRDWRGGELTLLLAALVVAIASVTAVALLVDRLQQALLDESADFLAADRYIGGSAPIPDAFRDAARARGIDTVDTLSFPSMVFAGSGRSQLVSIKAVGDGYPLRGRLMAADVPFGPAGVAEGVPARGEVWLDGRLFPSLGVAVGDTVEVGVASFRVARVLVSEPDRGGSMFDLGPRLLMHVADVPRTEIVQPGSRIAYRLLLRGTDSALEALRAELPIEPQYRWRGIRESSPSIGAALDRAERFLLLGGLLGVLLAGVAVALAAHRYARRHFDHVAILKTLGATPRSILQGFLTLLALVGAVAVVLGLLLGGAAHLGMVALLQNVVPIELPPPTLRPFALGAATGFICALAFALPPLFALHRISPMRVIRRDLDDTPAGRIASYGSAAAGVLGLLLWYTGSLSLTAWTLVGSFGVLLVFGPVALLLLRGGRVLGMQAGSGWRLALAGLQRRRHENVAQILIFGLAIMLLLILVLLRTALLEQWRGQLPADAPNHFVMNVTPAQVDAVQDRLAAGTTFRGEIYPMIRGRIVTANGVAADEWEERIRADGTKPIDDGDGDGPNMDSERNLTWSNVLPEGNKLVDGDWWAADDATAWVSLEAEYAQQLGLDVGDLLEFDIAGQRVTAAVANLRSLDWESLQPNFFIIFSPGVLEDYPATFMTSFHLPASDKAFLNDFLAEFPTVTVIEVDALIVQIQRIVARVTQAIELVLGLVLAAGCLVLVASIQSSRDARLAEHALLRTLGAPRRLIVGALAAEFAVLGFCAGVVAVLGAEISAALLQRQVFGLPHAFHPWLWLFGPLGGALLVLAVGLLSARRLVATPPLLVLRGL